jgi:predicted nucleotidyltransferase
MLQKSSLWKTASVFFDRPTEEHYLVGISRDINLAHTSVKKHLMHLVREGVIVERILERGNRRFPVYTANINSREYRKHKKIANLISLADSGLIEHIEEKLMPRSIVLFGSYARGEDAEDSDIDLFVECRQGGLKLQGFERLLKRGIQLHFNDRFTSYPKELKNNISNGIVMTGFLEAFK